VVAFGSSPLVFINTFTGTLFAHWNTSAACGTASICRTTTVQCTSCATVTADLSITKTDFRTTYTPGSNSHTYIVEATNNGPSAVTGATITDILPPEITSATWTVTYPGGGSGPANGTGDINALVNLPNGAKARFVLDAHISPSATGNLINTATVTEPTGATDPTPGNNSATDTDAPKTADMSITKTDGTSTYIPGTSTTYTIVATNNGPDEVNEKTISDILPPEITSATWTATYAGGAAGPASGAGNINVMIDFPAGSSATFTLVANISPTATGNLVNTATIATNGYIDPNPADNTATDINTFSLVTCTITCPANITATSDVNQCGAIVNYPVPTTSGSCGTITTSPASGSFFPIGTTTVTATSTAGPSCTFTITVNDTQAPIITCPSPVTVSCASDVAAPNPGSIPVIDNCPGAIVTHIGDAISLQTCANKYTILRTYRVTDAAGNFRDCTQTIMVNDQTPPVLTCPAPITVNCAAAVPAANTALVTGVSDNCIGAITVTHVGDVISNQTCANKFLITRTYRATDVCGNFTDCTQLITVNDVTPPTLTCPASVTVSCAAAVPAANLASVTGVSDNCSGTVTVTHVGDVISAQTCANRYIITRTYRATDVCGNVAQCTQLITVNDNTAPVLTCPSPITATTPPGSCTAVVSFAPTATDNCTGAVTVTAVPASGTAFAMGTTTVTVTATDVCGNSSTCTFTVTVLDGQLPVISSQPANRTACAGSTALFSVTASNALSYQWEQWNGITWTAIQGATGSALTLTNAALNMNTNTYRVKVIGLCTTVISGPASLYVNPLPVITLVPSRSPVLLPGQVLTITAAVTPAGGNFAWFKNGAVMNGVIGGALPGLTVDDIGTYRAVYTDLNGCVSTSGDMVVSGFPSGNLYVYPNPNKGQFQVRFYNTANETASVKVFDDRGNTVFSRGLVTTIPYTRIDVDISRMPAGTYLVELVNSFGKRIGVKRIIKLP
jgi:uncharacterized repeat protein (TIGR01451 family)